MAAAEPPCGARGHARVLGLRTAGRHPHLNHRRGRPLGDHDPAARGVL